MPFVARNALGRIEAVFAKETDEAHEQVPSNAPELESFLFQRLATPDARAQLSATDGDMARLLEDLIEILQRKGVLEWNDFSPAAQRKLLFRKDLRWQMQHPLPQ
jgi:hypothetical protein